LLALRHRGHGRRDLRRRTRRVGPIPEPTPPDTPSWPNT
jgi:hypothetical protein